MIVPRGIALSGREFPGLISAVALARIVSPTLAKGCKHIAFLTVNIVEKCNAGAPVRIVLDSGNLGRNIALVPAEIDYPVFLLVTATDMPGRYTANTVPAAALLKCLKQRLFRFGGGDFLKSGAGLMPAPC
jgi:hypothetical protein